MTFARAILDPAVFGDRGDRPAPFAVSAGSFEKSTGALHHYLTFETHYLPRARAEITCIQRGRPPSGLPENIIAPWRFSLVRNGSDVAAAPIYRSAVYSLAERLPDWRQWFLWSPSRHPTVEGRLHDESGLPSSPPLHPLRRRIESGDYIFEIGVETGLDAGDYLKITAMLTLGDGPDCIRHLEVERA